MEQLTSVDFAAVGRVSKYAELKDIRLIDVSAKCSPAASAGPLKAEVFHESAISDRDQASFRVESSYKFLGRDEQSQVVEICIKYLVVYAMSQSPEPLSDADVAEFAKANGTLHSWPFVRESLHSFTYKMGFPPFKLGVMHFVPLKPTNQEETVNETETDKPTS